MRDGYRSDVDNTAAVAIFHLLSLHTSKAF